MSRSAIPPRRRRVVGSSPWPCLSPSGRCFLTLRSDVTLDARLLTWAWFTSAGTLKATALKPIPAQHHAIAVAPALPGPPGPGPGEMCNMDLVVLPNASSVDRGAVCLDGSPPAIYISKANTTADPGAATKWVLYFKGGGWCYDVRIDRSARIMRLPSRVPSCPCVCPTATHGNRCTHRGHAIRTSSVPLLHHLAPSCRSTRARRGVRGSSGRHPSWPSTSPPTDTAAPGRWARTPSTIQAGQTLIMFCCGVSAATTTTLSSSLTTFCSVLV